MKKRIIYVAILSAMICATILSGCNNTEVTSNDTEPVTTSAVVTTVAPTTQTTETIVTPTTAVETTVAETEVKTEPQATEPQTEAPKVETEKPETNKPSNNANNSGNSTTTQKPAQNINNNTSDNKKPSDNTSQTVTDDTKLTHKQFSTETNMQRVSSALNSHFTDRGMILDTSLTIDNSGWMFAYQGAIDKTATRSYNEHLNRIIIGMDEQVDAMNDMYGVDSTGVKFNCYAELQSDGEYNIYYCYK